MNLWHLIFKEENMKKLFQVLFAILLLFIFGCQENPVDSTIQTNEDSPSSLKKTSSITGIYLTKTVEFPANNRTPPVEWGVYMRVFGVTADQEYVDISGSCTWEWIPPGQGYWSVNTRNSTTEYCDGNLDYRYSFRVTYQGKTSNVLVVGDSNPSGIKPSWPIPNYKFLGYPSLNTGIVGTSEVTYPNETEGAFTKIWSANVSNGTAPYTYQWIVNGQFAGSESTYSKPYYFSGCDKPDQYMNIVLNVSSSDGQFKSTSKTVREKFPKSPLSCSINGPSTIVLPQKLEPSINKTWTANVAGGLSPYSYKWYYANSLVSTSSSYTRSFSFGGYNISKYFDLRLEVTDANGGVHSYTKSLHIVSNEPN